MSTPLDCTFPPHIQSDFNALLSIHAHLCLLVDDYSDHNAVSKPINAAANNVADALDALQELLSEEGGGQ